MEDNILRDNFTEEDFDSQSLRPNQFKEFIGQKKIIDNLEIFAQAAKKRKESLDHVLLYGPPGLGKTSLAQIIAKEMQVNIKSTSGPIISKSGDLAAILTNLEENDVLFIDEIHRLNSSVEEMLYSSMEDFTLDIIIGEGPAARSVKIDLPKFTLVGATTRIGLLTNPLRDRFGINLRFDFYNTVELTTVIQRAAKILDLVINYDAAFEIASRSRGTPRISLRLLKRVRDFATNLEVKMVDKKIAKETLNKLDIDSLGLDSNDHRYLTFIINNYNGGPVGIETISAGLSEQKDTLEETIEPFLLQQGLIQRTSRGRMVTLKCYNHLNIVSPIENNNLF